MSTQKDHIDKARHNEQFFSSLDIETTSFLDWVVTGIFYSALQYLDSYLANHGEHPDKHFDRINLIWAKPDLGRSFFRLYRPLEDDSRDGRYRMRTFTPDEVRNDIIPLLEGIKRHLRHYVPQIVSP
jgi:hypothetical protein